MCVCLLSPLTAPVYKLSSPGIGNMDASHSEKLVRFQLEKYPDVRVMYHKYYTTFCSPVMKYCIILLIGICFMCESAADYLGRMMKVA